MSEYMHHGQDYNYDTVVFNLSDTNISTLMTSLHYVIGSTNSCNTNQECLLANIGELVPYHPIPPCYVSVFKYLPSETIMGSRGLKLWEVLLKSVLNIVVMIMSVGGNLWVIATILLTPSMHIPTYYYLASLAVSDLVVGVLCMPLHLGRHINLDWPFGKSMCKIYHASQSKYKLLVKHYRKMLLFLYSCVYKVLSHHV